MPIETVGAVVPFLDWRVLVFGPDAGAFGEPAFGPPAYVRPGYKLWGANDYLLPAEAIDDIGQRFQGPAAYEWIETRGDAFPRADVIGVRLSGRSESVFMKELDLAVLALFAGSGPEAPVVKLDLALEALAAPDPSPRAGLGAGGGALGSGLALSPTSLPPELELYERALPCYRLAPGVFGALGAALVHKVLASGRRDLTITFDDLDDIIDW
jgi:hypothetical protein